MSIPERIMFEHRGTQPDGMLAIPARQRRRWRRVRFGAPRKGEYYVSGAIPMAYIAPNDLTMEYLIVEPVGTPLGEVECCPTCGRANA